MSPRVVKGQSAPSCPLRNLVREDFAEVLKAQPGTTPGGIRLETTHGPPCDKLVGLFTDGPCGLGWQVETVTFYPAPDSTSTTPTCTGAAPWVPSAASCWQRRARRRSSTELRSPPRFRLLACLGPQFSGGSGILAHGDHDPAVHFLLLVRLPTRTDAPLTCVDPSGDPLDKVS